MYIYLSISSIYIYIYIYTYIYAKWLCRWSTVGQMYSTFRNRDSKPGSLGSEPSTLTS